MKKQVYFFLLVAIASCLCSSTKPPTDKSLIEGTWMLIEDRGSFAKEST